MKPIEGEHTLESHLLRLQHLGYTLVYDALPPDLVSRLVDKIDELMPTEGTIPGGETTECLSRDVNRLYDRDPIFEDLMDCATVFPIVVFVGFQDFTVLALEPVRVYT